MYVSILGFNHFFPFGIPQFLTAIKLDSSSRCPETTLKHRNVACNPSFVMALKILTKNIEVYKKNF